MAKKKIKHRALEPKEHYNDSMTPLVSLLKTRKISYTLSRHVGADPKVEKLIGYYPTGKWHVVINEEFSVIRGMCSWGLYEVMNIKGGSLFKEPERFSSPNKLLNAIHTTDGL